LPGSPENWKTENAMETPDTPDINPIRELTHAIKLGKNLADKARADLIAATPLLIAALQHDSGQSVKLERILLSCWNDDHTVNLCDALSGLGTKLARAAVSMIAARAHLSGDADDMLRNIIEKSGSHPPVA
jgi:hypothetical protein